MNPKDCMVVTLRSGREIERRKEKKKKNTEKVEGEETRKENKLSSSDLAEDTEKRKKRCRLSNKMREKN